MGRVLLQRGAFSQFVDGGKATTPKEDWWGLFDRLPFTNQFNTNQLSDSHDKFVNLESVYFDFCY